LPRRRNASQLDLSWGGRLQVVAEAKGRSSFFLRSLPEDSELRRGRLAVHLQLAMAAE
jgi:hypothetical protein